MIFKPFFNFDTGCAAYFLGCATSGTGLVVDPLLKQVKVYRDFAKSKNLKITHVIDTHIHADHRSGGSKLARLTGAQYCLHEKADLAFPFRPLKDNESIALGNVKLKILHTPGHTPESICIEVTDLRRSKTPWFFLTGDTLFSGAVGRPDLPGNKRQSAAQLYASLHKKLFTYPDDLEFFPGHFSGSVCGAGMSGKPSSTFGFEKRANKVLQMSKTHFINEITRINSERPKEMVKFLRQNRESP